MKNIQILDCTLRDGGYCNEWEFGNKNIKKIIKNLVDAGVDIVECGFLTEKAVYSKNFTKYNTIHEINEVLPAMCKKTLFVSMINYGEYDIGNIAEYCGYGMEGIRVAFHKRDLYDALTFCKCLKEKGYKVFIQPMVSLSYTADEFLHMVEMVNRIGAYAFYIVDSFGTMKKKELLSLVKLVEGKLNRSIKIGFHSHNNMQLAFANAQCLVDMDISKRIIIDSSVYGMGRGAGNLNTELLVEYLNENIESSYKLKPLLLIIDEVLNGFYQKKCWGYSLPNYLSAVHNAHPNYAGYLLGRNTLTIEAMNKIFSMMKIEKKYEYDREYIEDLYVQYMQRDERKALLNLNIEEVLRGKTVVLVAPGKSSAVEAERIRKYVLENDVVVISVNFDYQYVKTDFIFLSNMRRFNNLPLSEHKKTIITSNIEALDVCYCVNYHELLNSVESVQDNAGMMAIRFLINMGVKKIELVGFDGYSYNTQENYATREMEYVTQKEMLDAMNKGMTELLKKFSSECEICFLTDAKHLSV